MRHVRLRYLITALGVFLPIAAQAATLSLSPSSSSFGVGSLFTVRVVLDTSGVAIQGVDLDYLSYNPSLLEVQDADSSQSGTQIIAGSLMPVTVVNSVDPNAGRVLFSQITAGGGNYTGNGTLTQISFRAKAAGQASVTINFTPGSTSDSNVASFGSDVLSSVTNGSYGLTSGSAAPVATSPPASPVPLAPTISPSSPASLSRPTSAPAPATGKSAAPSAPRAAPTSMPRSPSSAPRFPSSTSAPNPSPLVSQEPGTTPRIQNFWDSVLDKARDPFSIYFAVTVFIILVSVAFGAYRLIGFVGGRVAFSGAERDRRIKKIMDFVIAEMSKRHSREEIIEGLKFSSFNRGEIDEALRRLKLK